MTRLVTALETRLGAQLFTRTTRQVVLAEAGVRLRADAARILAELEAAKASATGAHEAQWGCCGSPRQCCSGNASSRRFCATWGALIEVLGASDDREMSIRLMHSEGRAAAAKICALIDLAARESGG